MGGIADSRPGQVTARTDVEERIERTAAAARTANDLAADARERRDEAIAEGDSIGLGLRHMAKLAGLARSHVQRIVVEATARRQSSSG